jgi:hypothetical protein
MVRRFLVALALGATVTAFVVPVASATPPGAEPFSGSWLLHAGQMCDFEYLQEFSGTDVVTVLNDGRVQIHEEMTVTHTNLDTDYVLTETDHANLLFMPDGSQRQTVVWFHLRDPNGKLVVLQAGQALFDADFNLIKVTGNLGDDFASVICPALGGNPA